MTQFTGNSIPYVPPSAPAQQQIEAINRIIDQLNALQNSITLSDGSTRRFFMGYQKDGFGIGKHFGIKISSEGKDVMTASDSDLEFKMDISTWYWYSSGVNFLQIGTMPDGSNNIVVAKPGKNVAELYQ